jgi:AcrR family transcriptional regulator
VGEASKATAYARQRSRLLEGLVHTAANRGYLGASVTAIVGAAGVSRATFYEHFADRDECFLAAHSEIAARFRAAARGAFTAARPADRPRAVLQALLAQIAADPDSARLLFIEALAASPSVRLAQERLIADTTAAIDRFLDASEAQALQIPALALLGGIAGVLSMRIFRDAAASVVDLADDLLAWVDSYKLPPDKRRRGDELWEELSRGFRPQLAPELLPHRVVPLPRGRNSLAPSEAARERRERILAAVARTVAAQGYAATSVADIVASAKVTRSAFYSHFASKEDAFLAAQDAALEGTVRAAANGYFLGSEWPQRFWCSGLGVLEYMRRHPDSTYLEVVELNAVGAKAISRDYETRAAFSLFVEEGYHHSQVAARLPRLCIEAISGAIFALIRRQVLRGRAEEMLEVLPQGVYVATAPFIGATRALALVEAEIQSAR